MGNRLLTRVSPCDNALWQCPRPCLCRAPPLRSLRSWSNGFNYSKFSCKGQANREQRHQQHPARWSKVRKWERSSMTQDPKITGLGCWLWNSDSNLGSSRGLLRLFCIWVSPRDTQRIWISFALSLYGSVGKTLFTYLLEIVRNYLLLFLLSMRPYIPCILLLLSFFRYNSMYSSSHLLHCLADGSKPCKSSLSRDIQGHGLSYFINFRKLTMLQTHQVIAGPSVQELCLTCSKLPHKGS